MSVDRAYILFVEHPVQYKNTAVAKTTTLNSMPENNFFFHYTYNPV